MADYVYAEYPRLLYKGDETKRVHDDDEKQAALEAGFALTPDAPADPIADAAPDAQAVDVSDEDAIDAEIAAPKKKPGRPKKAE